MNQTNAIFNHPDTYAWIANLSGRATDGPHHGSPSYYRPGDYSLPHADCADDRTVAYVWHLSRRWRPEFGGALYWTAEADNDYAYNAASYNTLNLFSVTRYTQHFVTAVAPNLPSPEYKRLTWNGWWRDQEEYDFANDSIEDVLVPAFDSYEGRLHLTDDQVSALLNLDLEELQAELLSQSDRPQNIDQVQDRLYRLQEWQTTYWDEINQPRQSSLVVDLYGRSDDDEVEGYE